jgi:hypothetical protein
MVMIGPAAAGKSTIGERVAALESRCFVDLDVVGDRYYSEVGQELAAFHVKFDEIGFDKAHRWWQPARCHAVRRVLEDHPDAVLAFGAGHSHFEDDRFAHEVTRILAGAVVVLLLPDPDPEVSLSILRERCASARGYDWNIDGIDYLRTWITSDQNFGLANVVAYERGDDLETFARRVAGCAEE